VAESGGGVDLAVNRGICGYTLTRLQDASTKEVVRDRVGCSATLGLG
jgi:hypothetical protein